jgi:hypothetical protein
MCCSSANSNVPKSLGRFRPSDLSPRHRHLNDRDRINELPCAMSFQVSKHIHAGN